MWKLASTVLFFHKLNLLDTSVCNTTPTLPLGSDSTNKGQEKNGNIVHTLLIL